MQSALYRRYDQARRLLYVGVSDWPYDRAIGHGMNSLWVQFATSGTTEWFPTRQEAEAAEKLAIATELPLFNRYHSAPAAKERLETYFIEQGREDLLEVIVDWKWNYRGPRRRKGAQK